MTVVIICNIHLLITSHLDGTLSREMVWIYIFNLQCLINEITWKGYKKLKKVIQSALESVCSVDLSRRSFVFRLSLNNQLYHLLLSLKDIKWHTTSHAKESDYSGKCHIFQQRKPEDSVNLADKSKVWCGGGVGELTFCYSPPRQSKLP